MHVDNAADHICLSMICRDKDSHRVSMTRRVIADCPWKHCLSLPTEHEDVGSRDVLEQSYEHNADDCDAVPAFPHGRHAGKHEAAGGGGGGKMCGPLAESLAPGWRRRPPLAKYKQFR